MLITKDNYGIYIDGEFKYKDKYSFDLPIITKGSITSEEINNIILKLQDYKDINYNFIDKICSSLEEFKKNNL